LKPPSNTEEGKRIARRQPSRRLPPGRLEPEPRPADSEEKGKGSTGPANRAGERIRLRRTAYCMPCSVLACSESSSGVANDRPQVLQTFAFAPSVLPVQGCAGATPF